MAIHNEIVDLSLEKKKKKFSMKDFFSKCGQIRRKLWIWSHLLKKSLIENFIFCAEFYSISNICSTVTINYLTRLRVGFSVPREHTFCHNFRNSMNSICIFDKAVRTTKLHFLPKSYYTFLSAIKVLHMKCRRFCKILKKSTPIFTG